MFVPEYSITAKTLKSIASIEYSKAVIESTVILPQWETQLQSQAIVDETYANLLLENRTAQIEAIKKAVDSLTSNPPTELVNFKRTIETLRATNQTTEVEESDLKDIHRSITAKVIPDHKSGTYRSSINPHKTKPEEILAEVVELFDWVNSIDAKDTHPLIVVAITKARLEQIAPYEQYNTSALNLMTVKLLQTLNYSFKNYISCSTYFYKGLKEYKNTVDKLDFTHDYTQWIEYFTQGFAMMSANVQEKVKLLARDTKVAKVTGRTRLSQRQEKIIEYLQDYGILQNKDFPRLFPDKSEDSILRDLKNLVDLGLVQKTGSTKSSRYELK
jgi:Fic family protein